MILTISDIIKHNPNMMAVERKRVLCVLVYNTAMFMIAIVNLLPNMVVVAISSVPVVGVSVVLRGTI